MENDQQNEIKKKNITVCLFDEIWRKIFKFLCPKEMVRSYIAIPIIRQSTLHAADFLEIAKQEIESHGHDYKGSLGRLGMLTENDGLMIMNFFYKQRKCFRSGCLQLFSERYNYKDSCAYHPGKCGAGKILTCCRNNGFKSAPCKRGFHDGKVFDAIMFIPNSVNEGNNDSKMEQTSSNISALPPIAFCSEIEAPSTSISNTKQNNKGDFKGVNETSNGTLPPLT